MELLLRTLIVLINIVGILVYPLILIWTNLFYKRTTKIPPIKDNILNIPVIDLTTRIRKQEIKSEDLVRTYIERIKEVNPFLNAVVEDRFEEALKDAKNADKICQTTPSWEVIRKYPLLGIPFTVKESCGVKGMSQVVGNLSRNGVKCPADGDGVDRLRAAGAIPLLVSNNPEYCLSWETSTLTNGRCFNPYDSRRTPGGSSGGEAALNGAGASPFGVGSDIAGSIRIPSLFTGIFGHKPTGGLVSVKGHFPISSDPKFGIYLQTGPMTRFARDLPLLLQIMAGENAAKLEFTEVVQTKDIKIHYLEDTGFTLLHSPIDFHIKLSILKAVEHFKRNGLVVKRLKNVNITGSLEMTLAAITSINDKPDMLLHPDNHKERDNVINEMLKHIYGKSKYSFNSLFFVFIQENNAFISDDKRQDYVKRGEILKEQLLEILGDNGVLFYPTYTKPAILHGTSIPNLPGANFSAIFNIFGFPATHVTMGFNDNGLPVGFQVIAAPYKDKLCLTIAGELEAAFGGWQPVAPSSS